MICENNEKSRREEHALSEPSPVEIREEVLKTSPVSAKTKKGRPKGSKCKNKNQKNEVEPVELDEQQEEDLDEARNADSEILVSLVPSMGKYRETHESRFAAKAVHLTLKGHYNYIDLLNYYRSRLPEKTEIKFYSIVREVGSKRGYKHTHVLLVFNKKLWTRAHLFLYRNEEGIMTQPNIRSKNHKTSIEQVVSYHYKDGDFPHTNIQIKSDSLGSEKLTQLLRLCQTVEEASARFCTSTLSNFTQIAAAWQALHVVVRTYKPLRILRQWQQEVLVTINRNLHPRQILFVVDNSGKGGKTSFSEHVASQMPTIIIRISNSRDVACLLSGEIQRAQDKKIRCVVFDFTRSSSTEMGDVYNILEQVRDGRVSAGKYVSHNIEFEEKPQVLVMVNKDIDYTKLTIDRYRVWYLLINHDSSIMIGKKYLSQYADENGQISSEQSMKHVSAMQNMISEFNRDWKRRMLEHNFISDSSSADEEGPASAEVIKARTTAIFDASITTRLCKQQQSIQEESSQQVF